MKLGKKPAGYDPRSMKLSDYLLADDLDVPSAVDYSKVVSNFPMYGNDKLGDCTCAAAGHLVQIWAALDGSTATPTDADVIGMYAAVNGGVDGGAVELDVLNHWKANPLSGWAPEAFVRCDPSDTKHIEASTHLFGGVYIGLELPVSAAQQVGKLWDTVEGYEGSVGGWGGHAVPIVAYDPDGLTCVTWGATQRMTWRFWASYCSEAYACLPNKWTGAKPTGFDFDALESDLAKVAA